MMYSFIEPKQKNEYFNVIYSGIFVLLVNDIRFYLFIAFLHLIVWLQ